MSIGIFGGAFNPPHIEHINMIKAALSSGLERIVIVPSFNAPHKYTDVSFSQRVDMLNIALLGEKDVVIDEIENEDINVHYSYLTVPKLKEKYGDDVVFIIGGDSLIDLNKWKHPELLIKECPIYVFLRGEDKDKVLSAKKEWEDKGANITIFDYTPKQVSSSLIRHYISLGVDVDFVDKKVLRYIKENGLYRDFDFYIQKLSTMVNEKTFNHSIRTALYALYINDKHNLNLNYDSVLIAALLHDCAKQLVHENVDKENVPIDSISTPVEHQFLGAIIAKKIFNIQDEEILNAIRYHTTGKENMSLMEKLIYSSDLLEEGRDMEFLIPLREKMEDDFEKGFIAIVEQQYNYLTNKNGDNIYYLTKECAKFYLKDI